MNIFSDGLGIVEEYRTNFVCLKLDGELTVKSVGRLSQLMQDIVDNRFRSIYFDFSNLNHLDSSGLGLFAKFRSQIEITIQRANHHVKEIFDITGLSQIIDISEDIQSL